MSELSVGMQVWCGENAPATVVEVFANGQGAFVGFDDDAPDVTYAVLLRDMRLDCPACEAAQDAPYPDRYSTCEDHADGPDVGAGGYPVFEGSEKQAFGPGPYTAAEQARHAKGL